MVATPDRLQREVAELGRLANGDLDRLWTLILDRADAKAALMDILPALIDTYGLAASTLAADWYDDTRVAQNVTGRFTAISEDIKNSGAQALVGWADSKAHTFDSLKALVAGGVQRRVVNFARKTITVSSLADPHAEGWQRATRIGGCDFCLMLASRGAIYSESSVRFGAHDDCNCQAAPKFIERDSLVDVDKYRETLRSRSDDRKANENALAREWIEGNL